MQTASMLEHDYFLPAFLAAALNFTIRLCHPKHVRHADNMSQ